MHKVNGSFGMIFKAMRQCLQVRNEIYEKREKFQNIYGLTIEQLKVDDKFISTLL